MLINLTKSPIPLGDDEEDIRRDPTICYTCWNLYAGSMNTASFSPVVVMNSNSGSLNAARAAKIMDIGPAPAWAGGPLARVDYASWEISVTLADVPGSAASGCDSCRLLHLAIKALSEDSVDFNNRLLRLEVVICHGNVLRLNLKRDTIEIEADYAIFDTDIFGGSDMPDEGATSYHVASWELYTLPATPCPWPSIGNFMNAEYPRRDDRVVGGCARHISSDAASDTLFDRISTWIQCCKRDHPTCAEVDSLITGKLPKRALYVGPASNDGIRLVEYGDSDHQVDAPYIALSHCWGPTQHLTTERHTLGERKKNIPFGSMSRNFQDAIIITRKLGVQYVWIDSLCIIQGDKQDWEIEAAKMASIYNSAYLVVAATASPDGSGGCLFDRKPHITINGTTSTGALFEIHGRETTSHEIFGWDVDKDLQRIWDPSNTRDLVNRHLAAYPLMSRAWCFQERMLATRMLHYTKNEVVFECASSMSCECGALEDHEQDPHLQARRTVLTRPGQGPGTKVPAPGDYHAEDYESWRDFVIEFSLKKITYRSDGLPALAGLAAKWYQGPSTGRYLAGIWENDLLRSLAWVPKEEDQGQKHEYIAPSWSWVSAQRGVTWGGNMLREREYFVTIDPNRTECRAISNMNPFGQVSWGHIFMTGEMLPVKISRIDEQRLTVYLEKDGHPDTSLFKTPDSMHRIRKLQSTQLYCLRYCNFSIGGVHSADEDSALVLAKATQEDLDRQPEHIRAFGNVYVRLGITTYYLTERWQHDTEAQTVELYLI